METYPLYLNGRWVVTDRTLPIRNPATGAVIAQMSTCGRAEIAEALGYAHTAFGEWRSVVGRARGDFLRRIAAEVESRQEPIARTITLENGKPLAQSRAEVALSIDHLRWFAEEARRGYGRIVPHQVEGKRHLVLKAPVGVIAAITPWNFPLMLAVRKIAPALAAGCPIVLKPASATPLCAVEFARCVEAADVPSGVFQLVAGSAAELAAEFLDNDHCRKITFTGSTAVGRQLIAGAAARVKPLSLELGGCAPLLVFEDSDLETAVEGALAAKFRNTGQSCIAANRLYVQRPIYEPFLDLFTQRTRALKVGDGLEPGVDIGPLINAEAVVAAHQQVQEAVGRGARLMCGGEPSIALSGHFFAPAVLADVPASARCVQEEVFAPIAPIRAFDTEAEASELANATAYGLSAYVFTRDLARAFRLMESLEAGMIAFNDGVPTTSQCPFGGVKQSGWGRELGSEGLDAFLDTKHICLGLGSTG